MSPGLDEQTPDQLTGRFMVHGRTRSRAFRRRSKGGEVWCERELKQGLNDAVSCILSVQVTVQIFNNKNSKGLTKPSGGPVLRLLTGAQSDAGLLV